MSNTGYRVGWAIAAVVCAAYVLCFVHLAPLALQDYPNHLARAVVVNDLILHGGVKFGTAFSYRFLAIPYILNDWLLGSLIELAGIKSAAALWPVLVMLSLPAALLYYMRTLSIGRDQKIVGFLLSLYLVTNTFFFRGFLAFSLAVASVLLALGLARSLRRRRGILRCAIYCVVLPAAYLIHLTTLVFITAALVTSLMCDTYRRRTVNWRNEFLIFLPIAALLGWHFLFHPAVPGIESAATDWGSALGKIRHVDWTFIRFYWRQDLALLGLGTLACLWQAYWSGRHRAATPLVWEMLALALAFTAIYLVLPSGLGTGSWIDMRAVPMIALFLMLACLAPADPAQAQPRVRNSTAAIAIAVALSALAALANLMYLVHHLQPKAPLVVDYRAVVARIPPGSWVFPIYTNTTERPIKSTLHLAAYVLTDRQAFSPYQFSSDLGDPMQYFSYRNKPYAPDEDWYTDRQSEPVDWPAIEAGYDFVLVMKPFDAKRIPIATRPVFENDAAALMAIGSKSSVAAQGSAH